eukprot:CAMPEP_0118917112 /NCGR_PEP_ID=MMETSP1166-20130328/17044_1 /TAXON_ID=1104430 /ORGANISM="Chrysoreinhardia sp, Strain CCMP3193" /LENGTH=244 /DNA_ID=CAMNT_0006857171 /DNA_START=39 /DNA_END=773 /DNA_ORIENTATION=+
MWRCCSDRLALAICLTVVSVVSVVTLIEPYWVYWASVWATLKCTAETSGDTTGYSEYSLRVYFGLWDVSGASEFDVDFPPEKRIFRLNQVAAVSGAVFSLSFAALYYAKRCCLAEAGTADLWTGGTVLLLQAALTFIAFHYWVDYFTRRHNDIEDAFLTCIDSRGIPPSSVRVENVVACERGCGLQAFCAALYLTMSLAIFSVLLSRRRRRGHQTFNAVALEVRQQQTSALFVEEDPQEEDPKP